MPPPSWTAADLFSHCLDLGASEREKFLATLSGEQPEVVGQVRNLLAAHDLSGGFLDRPALEYVRDPVTGAEPTAETPPAGWGPWLRSRPRAFWVFLAIDFLAIGFYIFAGLNVARYKNQVVDWGFDTDLQAGVWHVASVDSQGPASSKLVDGDEILAINHGARTSPTGVLVAMQSIRPGSSYVLSVARDGIPREVTLTLAVKENPRRLGDIIAFGIVSLSFFGTAVILGLLKSDQK